jgi:hypothetical protein
LSSLFLYFQCLNERTHMIFKITSLGLLCAAISATPHFRHPTWRPFRAGMFIALGLSALFPVLHGVTMFGIRQMNEQIGLFWVVFHCRSLHICCESKREKMASCDPVSNKHILRSKYRSVYILACSISG